MSVRRVHVFVAGLVQGVYYRQSAKQEADRLGVNGWVRNLHDGRVEAVVEGEVSLVEAWIAWARQGPPAAAVEKLSIEEESPANEAGFHVLSTHA